MAFRKPLDNLKTSAPLRGSDWRKLKQRIAQVFDLRQEDADLLVPQGLTSVKFITHLDDQGIAYFASDGDPLWFTVGKGSDILIPTVYALWKYPLLLPCLSTPSSVLPILMGGADLMIPGVVSHPNYLQSEQLVSVCQHAQNLPDGTISPPLAVGFMAVDSNGITENAKGKAVRIIHTAGDKLWELGSEAEPPSTLHIQKVLDENVVTQDETEEDLVADLQDLLLAPADESNAKVNVNYENIPLTSKDGAFTSSDQPTLSAEEVSTLLRSSLLQAIQTNFSEIPASTFPIPSTTFYTSYILPSRPEYQSSKFSTPIDIKHSTHKSLTAFLRVSEKEGFIRLKEGHGKADSGAPSVLGVSLTHPDVDSHVPFKTIADAEAKRARREEQEAKKNAQNSDISVTELWKPYQQTLVFFEENKEDVTVLYPLHKLKSILNEYIAKRSLVNSQDQQYINVDDLLQSSISSTSNKSNDRRKHLEFLKREDLLNMFIENMQAFYLLKVSGHEPTLRKGQLKPISVAVKIRQGRKACTLVTNFEPYLLSADAMAEELRRLCASSTSVTPLPGKNSGMEVMVQGNQIKAVTNFLISKGITMKWIKSADMSDKKKK